MYDTLIIAGRVPDFEKGELVRVEVALKDGKIAALLPPGERPAANRVLEAAGMVVSPGFIDLHMHEEDFAASGGAYNIGRYMAGQGVTTCVGGNCGEQYQSMADFRAVLAAHGGAPVNYILLAGYNSLREKQGLGWYESASAEQRAALVETVRRELEEGAWGFSFGLEYGPGISGEEMTGAVTALREYDPLVSIHFRADCEGCMASLEEMAALSRRTGCRVQVSHLSSLAGTAHNMPAALAFLEREMKENPLLGYDTYPYTAFSTGIGTAVFDGDWRSKWGVDYDSVLLVEGPHAGQRCTGELFEATRRQTPGARVVAFAMEEESIRAAVAHPMGLLGSDGILAAGGGGHPRAAGTYPRILGKYVREEGAMPLLTALDKMTRRAAARLGLKGKGEVRPGMDADLTVFDPETIADGPDFTSLDIPNRGIRAVLLAGVPVVENNALTGALPGRFLTRTEWRN